MSEAIQCDGCKAVIDITEHLHIHIESFTARLPGRNPESLFGSRVDFCSRVCLDKWVDATVRELKPS